MEEKFKYGESELNVDVSPLTEEIVQKQKEEYADKMKEALEKMGEFPPIGTMFIIENQTFKVNYVNEGKGRVTVIYIDTRDDQYHTLPELDSTCTIHGKLYKITFKNELKRRLTLEHMN